jgi:lysophospholipase L1-like esterase
MPDLIKTELETALDAENICFYNIKQSPFKIYGLYEPLTEAQYRRIPADVAEATSKDVATLATNTSGGRVRFSTDSEYVAVKVKSHSSGLHSNMCLCGTSAFDVYLDSDAGQRFILNSQPQYPALKEGHEAIVHLGSNKMRYYTVYFPTYNSVDEVYIGLEGSATVSVGDCYRSELPVVYYGSSITQGGCASRPGLTYTSIISRKYDLDFINLGFSGSGRAEKSIVDYMATLDMLAFVSDYDYNAKNAEELNERHLSLYKTIREAHPDIPYIMITRPNTLYKPEDAYDRRDVVVNTYRYAREHGDKNVYFIDGDSFFLDPNDQDCTVDGVHPNDLGMSKMAYAIGVMLERSLRNSPLL